MPLTRTLTLLACLTALLIAGCGWQLRGEVRLPVDALAVRGGSLPLASRLATALADAGVSVSDSAPRRLQVTGERWQNRVIAVDSLGRALEQELRYELDWQLDRSDGQGAAMERQLVVTRSYSQRPDNAGGASDEARRTRELMVSEAVNRMMLQLKASAHRVPAP